MKNTQSESDEGAANALPTAQEVALEKTKYDDAPITTAFWLRLRSGKRPPWGESLPELCEGKVVAATPRTAEAICWSQQMGEGLCAEEQLERLRSFQAQFDALIKKANDLPSPNDMLNSRREEIQARVRAGEDPGGLTMLSRDDAAATHRARQGAIHDALVQLARDAAAIAGPILQRFELWVEKFMREQEVAQRALCDGFGLPLRPSYVWQAAAQTAALYRPERRLPLAGQVKSPREILAGLADL